VGEEERMAQVGGQEERVGEGEGLGLGVEEDERVGKGEEVGLVEEDEAVEGPISRFGRGGRVLKKPAKYS